MLPRCHKAKPDGRHYKANNELVSQIDHKATVVSKSGFDMHLAYKIHIVVADVRGKVVTAAIITTGARSDEHQLADVPASQQADHATSERNSSGFQIWHDD
jgi:hypothetical protein